MTPGEKKLVEDVKVRLGMRPDGSYPLWQQRHLGTLYSISDVILRKPDGWSSDSVLVCYKRVRGGRGIIRSLSSAFLQDCEIADKGEINTNDGSVNIRTLADLINSMSNEMAVAASRNESESVRIISHWIRALVLLHDEWKDKLMEVIAALQVSAPTKDGDEEE